MTRVVRRLVQPGPLAAVLGLLVADIGIALSWPLGSIAVASSPPLAVAVGRYVVALAALGLVTRVDRDGRGTSGYRRPLAVMGLAMAVYNVVYLVGLATSSPAGGSLVACASMPLFAALLARLGLRERLAPRAAVGIVVGATGIAVVASGTAASGEALQSWPFLVGGLVWAVHTVIARAVIREAPLLAATTWSVAFGLLVLAAALLLSAGPAAAVPLVVGAMPIAAVMGIVSTALPLWLTMVALRELKVGAMAATFLLVPLLASVSSALLVGSPITERDGAGGALALLGVALTATGGGQRTVIPPSTTRQDPVIQLDSSEA